MSGDTPPRPAPADSQPDTSNVCVARIKGAYGVRGEVRLHIFTEEPDALPALGPFADEAGVRIFTLKALRDHGEGYVARFAEIATREEADALGNTDLYVPRERLPALEEEETYYHADLIGLTVRAPDGAVLGKVAAVQNFGAGDILDIAPAWGGATAMVPFSKAMVPAVDLAAGHLTLAAADLLPPPKAPKPAKTPRTAKTPKTAKPQKEGPKKGAEG